MIPSVVVPFCTRLKTPPVNHHYSLLLYSENIYPQTKLTMSEAAATPKKVVKKVVKPKAKPSHPPTSEMVNNAVKTLKERGGSSLQAIKKFIAANYKVDVEKLAPFIKKYLKSAVVKGVLIQTKGKGANGSFKLSAVKKEKKVKAKKPAVKKVKKVKPATKKSPKKAAKKPAAPKKEKKAKTPKKVKAPKPKKVVKKVAKKAAPKKK